MGFPIEMTDVMIEKEYSHQYTCGPNGPLGSSGPPTAYGVFISLEEAVKFLGYDNIDGWSFACQGLGQVGYAMVREICEKVKNLLLRGGWRRAPSTRACRVARRRRGR